MLRLIGQCRVSGNNPNSTTSFPQARMAMPIVGDIVLPAGHLSRANVPPNKRLTLTGGDRLSGIGVCLPWRAPTVVDYFCAGEQVARSLKAIRWAARAIHHGSLAWYDSRASIPGRGRHDGTSRRRVSRSLPPPRPRGPRVRARYRERGKTVRPPAPGPLYDVEHFDLQRKGVDQPWPNRNPGSLHDAAARHSRGRRNHQSRRPGDDPGFLRRGGPEWSGDDERRDGTMARAGRSEEHTSEL